MNGGAWLTLEGRRVDVMYRDLNDVEHWWREAEAGRYQKQLLPFHVARYPYIHSGRRIGRGRRIDR